MTAACNSRCELGEADRCFTKALSFTKPQASEAKTKADEARARCEKAAKEALRSPGRSDTAPATPLSFHKKFDDTHLRLSDDERGTGESLSAVPLFSVALGVEALATESFDKAKSGSPPHPTPTPTPPSPHPPPPPPPPPRCRAPRPPPPARPRPSTPTPTLVRLRRYIRSTKSDRLAQLLETSAASESGYVSEMTRMPRARRVLSMT